MFLRVSHRDVLTGPGFRAGNGGVNQKTDEVGDSIMNALEGRWRSSIRDLQEKESYLEQRVGELASAYSGLKDIDLSLQLINTKFTLAIRLIDLIAESSSPNQVEEMGKLAKREAIEAFELLEALTSDRISLDQKELILESSEYEAALELFHHLLLEGGGAFFESKIEDRRNAAVVADVIAQSIAKYSPPDDRYDRVFKIERLPSLLKQLFATFFPNFAAENQKDPPLGIEEGEQTIYHAEKIRMPLSQAIHYYEEELLPELQQRLRDNPGDSYLQRQIDTVERLVREYRELRFVPRSTPGSTPIIVGKDFYTSSITEYTAEGELMVSVDLPVAFNSGTNLERIQELVQADVTRRLAGRGVCPDLDEQYLYIKSLASGIKGSTRTPSMKLNIRLGFASLKRQYPVVRHLENKQEFKRLLDMVVRGERRKVRQLLTQSILSGDFRPKELS